VDAPVASTVNPKVVIFPKGGFAVFYHDDEKGHIIIGEAAVSLAAAGTGRCPSTDTPKAVCTEIKAKK
jgi:hypothetical protein